MNISMILTKDFVANESVVVDIKPFGYRRTLVFQNKKGQLAKFLWQSNDIDGNGYFKEVINDLGVKIAHYDGFITVTNGGGRQHLEIEILG